MYTKIKDAKASTLQQKEILHMAKKRILEENDDKRFVLKKMIKLAKNNLHSRKNKRKQRYEKKVTR